MKSMDEFFFYYQDGDRKASAIEVFVTSEDSASAVTRSASIELNGRIMGIYKDKNLVVLTLHKDERILKVTEILGDKIRSEEHTSELQSREKLVCRLLLEKKKEHERKI